jgi:large subunit ribosomal protein L9
VAVEVLLRRTIEHLGKVGEVVRVKPGYARNYLFPMGLAADPSSENLRRVEKDKAVEAVLEGERAKERADLAARMAEVSLTIEAKANPEGHLFGSVGSRQVVERLVAKGFEVEERQVAFDVVRELGEYEATVRLGGDVEAKVKVWVVEELAPGSEGAAS